MTAQSAEEVVWKLEDLYAGPDAPELEHDRKWCLEEGDRLAATYRGKIGALGPGEMLAAIRQFESLYEKAGKLLSFGSLLFSTQTQDAKAGALRQRIQEFYALLRRDTLFFELEWTQLDDDHAKRIAEAPELSSYRHYLESLRRYKPHLLSETEERLLAEMEPVGSSAWGALFDKVLSRLQFGEAKRTESEVLSDLHRPEREARKSAAAELTEGLGSVLHILSHIFNTVLLDKAIDDRLRKYPHWLRARNLSNEADDAMVEALVQAVTARYDIVQRYYTLKRKLLGYDVLFDYDRYAPLPGPSQQAYSWTEAKEIVLSAYGDFSPRMAEIAGEFFEKSWIHAPVMPGKRSGAFAHSTVPSVHPYVFLNFTGKRRDIMTLAHELGHGAHQYLSRAQSLFNGHTPLTTAESASVFGEMLVFHYLLKTIRSPQERLALMCGKLEDIFATVFRQVAMNRFEEVVHNARREKGELDPEFISQVWMDTQSAMFGDSVQLLDHYRTWWSYIPHFLHSPGYVYAYAFGELLVLALYRQYREMGSAFVPLYLDLLSSGGKAAPNELLEPFGIDLADPLFWRKGLEVLEDLLRESESLVG